MRKKLSVAMFFVATGLMAGCRICGLRYWEKGWQSIIYGNDSSYLKKILDAGFDGVYLDVVDAFEYFESQ
ncbi:MAG: hypothetical protein ACUVUR_07715 [bacterium]